MERALIAEYERDLDRIVGLWRPGLRDLAIARASLPLDIRGFGHIKAGAVAEAGKRREALMAALAAPELGARVAAE